jgi:hypothetical protein
MLPSLRAFLSGIVDYAGLFPPARLPLDHAARDYARYHAGAESWMLGRFVVPAARLADLDPLVSLLSSGEPWRFSVLGRGGETVPAFRAGIEADLQAVHAFRSRHGSAALVDAFEVKWPAIAFREPDEVLAGPARAVGRACMTVVFELPATVPASILAGLRATAAGVKLRCGGLEPAAFPAPAEVAHVIAACRENGLPLKFTAGLHHPLRHLDRGLQTKMHGFLNVFGAAILAHARPLTEEQVRVIIEDEDASHFQFDQEGFRWQEHFARTEEVTTARREFVTAFGSCSFDEPRDDLRALGLFP